MQATRKRHPGRRFHQAAKPQADGAESTIRLCRALVNEGRLGEASGILGSATRRYPDQPALLALHGKVLLDLGQAQPAVGALMLALEQRVDDAEVLSNLVLAHLAMDQPRDALPHAIEAFRCAADAPRAVNLSCVLIRLGAYAEALDFANHALDLKTDYFEAAGNRALALEGLGRYEEAMDAGRFAVALAPDNASVRHNAAAMQLAAGHLTPEAWTLYEARLELKRHRLNVSDKLVRWRGEDITGRTILLHAEQGMGDTLQFVRYAPLVAARGANVVLVVQPALLRLLQDAPGVDQLLPVGQPTPPFDVYCPLLSLPGIFGTTLSSIPPVQPYSPLILSDAAALPATQVLRVGLVWAGNREFVDDQRRSLALAEFEALSGINGVKFYGLQYGSDEVPPPGLEITNLMHGVRDFADTARHIATLDLVVAADTGVAHLAATMGKPVWLLSRYRGCWRWLHDRADTPWYPTMVLYRQDRPNDWQGILGRLRNDLITLSASNAAQSLSAAVTHATNHPSSSK